MAHLILMSYFNIAKELFQKALTGLGLVWYYMSGQEESPQMIPDFWAFVNVGLYYLKEGGRVHVHVFLCEQQRSAER